MIQWHLMVWKTCKKKKLNQIVKSQWNHHRTFSRAMLLLTVNTRWLHSSCNQSMSYNVLLIPFKNKSQLIHEPENDHSYCHTCFGAVLLWLWSAVDWASSWQEVGPSYFAVQHKMHKSRNCRLCTGDAAQNELIANVTPFCSPHRIHVWPLVSGSGRMQTRVNDCDTRWRRPSTQSLFHFPGDVLYVEANLIDQQQPVIHTGFETDDILTKRPISWIAFWSKPW